MGKYYDEQQNQWVENNPPIPESAITPLQGAVPRSFAGPSLLNPISHRTVAGIGVTTPEQSPQPTVGVGGTQFVSGAQQPYGMRTNLSQAAPAAVSQEASTSGLINTGANLLNAGANVAKLAGAGAATTAAETGTGFLAALPGIASGIGAIGSLVSLGVQWYYASKQLANEENNAMVKSMAEREATAEEKRRFEINLDLTKQQLSEADRQARVSEALANRKQGLEEYTVKETIKMKKADAEENKRISRVNQAINLMMGTLNMFNSAANKQDTYNFWANRAK